jgi:hypothetical protein
MSLKRLLILLSVVFTAAACGPIVMLPGGKLDGTVVAAPNDWGFSDATKTVQLETRPSDPYSVNIWIIAMGSDLYVHAGDNRATWVDHLEAYERARVSAMTFTRCRQIAFQSSLNSTSLVMPTRRNTIAARETRTSVKCTCTV